MTVSVTRAEMYSQGSHGARPKATLESQQMCPAGMETGPTGVQPAFGASAQSSSPMGVSSPLPQPIEPSGRFPGALAGPVGILRSPVGTVEGAWEMFLPAVTSGLGSIRHKLPVGLQIGQSTRPVHAILVTAW